MRAGQTKLNARDSAPGPPPSAPSVGTRALIWLMRGARRFMPVHTRVRIHRRFEMAVERLERLAGRHDSLIPPSRLMFVGGSRHDFRPLGDKWLRTFIRTADLKPDESVLDVGCGVGRMAVALTRYLTPPQGRYEGFDIVRDGIAWCREEITPRFPNFHFQHADLYNKEYNPDGTLHASEYQFPYPDESFDFAFLTSVFTHMLPADVRQYLSEVRRVLRPGGRCLATFFVLDAEARARIQAGRVETPRRFQHDIGGAWAVDPQLAEAAVAYSESTVQDFFRTAGLSIQEPILYGAWSGRERPLSPHSQDIVLARK